MVTERSLFRLADKIFKSLKVRGATLDIFLLPNKDITKLKARFIKKKTEPNVLSFPEPGHFPHPELHGKKYLGEVYLNRDILRHSPKRTAPLLLHGILHLLGYDHKKKRDITEMEGLEAQLLKKLK